MIKGVAAKKVVCNWCGNNSFTVFEDDEGRILACQCERCGATRDIYKNKEG